MITNATNESRTTNLNPQPAPLDPRPRTRNPEPTTHDVRTDPFTQVGHYKSLDVEGAEQESQHNITLITGEGYGELTLRHHHSTTPPLHYSTTPPHHHTTTPPLHHSIIYPRPLHHSTPTPSPPLHQGRLPTGINRSRAR